jgi:hypothetical protein
MNERKITIFVSMKEVEPARLDDTREGTAYSGGFDNAPKTTLHDTLLQYTCTMFNKSRTTYKIIEQLSNDIKGQDNCTTSPVRSIMSYGVSDNTVTTVPLSQRSEA